MESLTPEQQEQFDQAIEALKNQVDINPSNWEAWLSLSELLAYSAPYDEATATIQKAIEAKPSENRGWQLMGQVIAREHGVGSGLSWLDEAIASNPARPGPRVAKAWLLTSSGDVEAAAEEYQAATEAFPDDWQAFSDLGVIYLRKGEAEPAAYYLEKASKLYRESNLVWFYLSSAYLMLGKAEEALAAVDEAILQENDHGPSYVNRAEAREKLGNTKLALADYRHAQTLLGKNDMIEAAIARLSEAEV